jgi:hypothetical protein
MACKVFAMTDAELDQLAEQTLRRCGLPEGVNYRDWTFSIPMNDLRAMIEDFEGYSDTHHTIAALLLNKLLELRLRETH